MRDGVLMSVRSGFSFAFVLMWATSCVVGAASADDRFQVLFNGQDLSGWDGLDQFWSVQSGTIVGQTTAENPTKANTFLIWQGGEVGDFEFRCKVRFEGNNSGVQYRSEVINKDGFALKGYQADLHPKQEYFGMMYGEKTGRGIIATRGQKVEYGADGKKSVVGQVGDGAKLDNAEWNELTIVAVGNRLVHQVNGVTTVDITDNHPDAALKGQLGLQLHAGPAMKVEFRNLLMRKLSGPEAAARLAEVTAATPIAAAEADRDEDWLTAKPIPEWVWTKNSKNGQKLHLRTSFDVSKDVKSAKVYATCDNKLELFINGKSVGKSPDWPQPVEKEVTKQLRSGKNVIAADCQNAGGTAAFVCKLQVRYADGTTETVVSDRSWKMNEAAESGWKGVEFSDATWTTALKKAVLGAQPWGVPSRKNASTGGRDALDPLNISVPPGFEISLVHRVTKDEGSWVALATDPQGRIYASDQAGAGLYRLTLRNGDEPLVERVETGAAKDLSGAQGLLWAFDSLWFHRNGGHLYRVTDSDGDDQLDTVEEIPGGTGGGEHGNHAVILSADGTKLFLDGGNAAPLGEYLRSRVQQWNEGLLLPRMWDAKGHARGRLAPGGWVTELDPKTYEQTVYTMGFRNQYDIALNRFGDVFTYDADMEWDLGMPWYRPTRICHVISGGDYGWRSGSGKWPTYYEDSLPPTVEIGPGSPTGVVSGLGAAFPTRYQDAIFALDWTFGTIYAIHLKEDGAGYVGEAEPFVVGSPLAVTDAAIGSDGAMFFAVGGRGSQSALYRVRYIGDESTEAPVSVDMTADAARKMRRELEAYHGVVDDAAIAKAWPLLGSDDRWLRHAARVAVESQPVTKWAEKVLTETRYQAAVTSAVALARMGDSSHREPLLKHLLALDPGAMTDGQLLGLLRAYALVFINLGKATAEERQAVIAELDPLLPHGDGDVNVELVRLMIHLNADSAVPKAMALIENRGPVELPDWSELASRNDRYGGTVQRMLDNHPPTRELLYAFMLRSVRKGWTMELRRQYFTFLNDAAKASGGASYGGFLTRIRDEALGSCSDAERKALQDVTGEDFDPKPDFPIAEIVGPGKKWTVDDAVGASRGKPDFENGRSLYFAAKCASCHRLSGLGGNIGPDLTSVRTKFDERYLVEAIVHPSKDISDQYGSMLVVLDDGRVLDGLAVEGEGTITIYSNKPDEEPIVVAKDAVLEMTPSKVSQMPEGLFDKLNAKEVRDLVAYVISGGDPDDKKYGKK